MVIIGGILLVPGVCALIFLVAAGIPSGGGVQLFSLAPLWFICFLISFGGFMLLRKAFR